MKTQRIVEILKSGVVDTEIVVKGWVRTKRGNKNVAFIALKDGSCVANIQVVVDLSKFGLKMAGNSVSATFYATNLVSDPVFRASADGRVDLGAVKEVYPLEKGVDLGGLLTADLKLSGRMSDIEKNRYARLGAQGTFVVEGVGLPLPNLPAVRIRRAAATVTPAS